MDLREKLIVRPGSSVKLSHIDASFHGHFSSQEDAGTEMTRNLAKLDELQQKLYAEKKHAVLVVLQGIDAAGKDGTCWHVLSAMNPQGTAVTGFKTPTPEESRHDFLWRIHRHVPELGNVGVFNRSHYEDVLVVRVHDLAPREVWSKRYDQINAFEESLALQNVTILKFFLYITPEEQLERFRRRLDDPARQWKISDADYKERSFWDQYIEAYEAMLEKCSTAHAPWYVIPSNHKWFRNLAVSQILENTLLDLKMELPKPTVDLEQIRREYHSAAKTPGHPESR